MEDTESQATLTSKPTETSRTPGPVRRDLETTVPKPNRWIVSPEIDLLFLANLPWVLAFLPGFVGSDGTVHFTFWQIYFITTPHRWLTLGLVALDPDRRGRYSILLVAIGVLVFVVVWGVRWFQGAFTCLLLIDFVWNAWHFASQHYGVLRIYDRKVGGGHRWLERIVLRAFLFYGALRTASWALEWTEGKPYLLNVQFGLDVGMLLVPVLFVALALVNRPLERLPRSVYLVSLCGLYGSLVVSLMANQTYLVAGLAVAASAFHAIEYLTLVSHYARRRRAIGSDGLFRRLATRWLMVLGLFGLGLGLFAYVAERAVLEWWLGLNLCVAFLHYAYDGLIWKLRDPGTARALVTQ
ncbi:MAG: hypothetical protein ACFCD0_13530 [Gemmataceae bacterium]